MANEITVINKGDYIYIECAGKYDLEKAKKCIDEMTESCQKYNCFNILADVRKQGTAFDEVDKLLIAEYIKTQLVQLDKLAILAEEEQLDPARFFETATASRGIFAKTFIDEEKATGWLIAN